MKERLQASNAVAHSQLALKAGEVMDGRFKVLHLIGVGGMGQVYLARQIQLDRNVAIKTLHPDFQRSENALMRFEREVRAIQKLTHPNTIRVYDFGRTPSGCLYLVMEYLDGENLDDLIARSGPLPLDTAVEIGAQVLKSLIEAHAMGIVHRDIKPGNLMVCRQIGSANFVKVLDFGLAMTIVPDRTGKKTQSGMTLGTPCYMSPEQLQGSTVDCRSDLYSLGLTLYELSTGKPAFSGSTPYTLALKHMSGEFPTLPQYLVHSRLGQVILKAAQVEPDSRFQSASDMLAALTGESLSPEPEIIRSAQPRFPKLATRTERKPVPEDVSGRSDDLLTGIRAELEPSWNAGSVSTPESFVPESTSEPPSVVPADSRGRTEGAQDQAGQPTVPASPAGSPRRATVSRGVLHPAWLIPIGLALLAGILVLLVHLGFFSRYSVDERISAGPATEPIQVTAAPIRDEMPIEAVEEVATTAVGSFHTMAATAVEDSNGAYLLPSTGGTSDLPLSAPPTEGLETTILFFVTSQPPGATVSLNDQEICTTPCREVLDSRQEPATIRVSLDGHSPFIEEVGLDQDVVLPVVLEPMVLAPPRRPPRERPAAVPVESPGEEPAAPEPSESDFRPALPIDF